MNHKTTQTLGRVFADNFEPPKDKPEAFLKRTLIKTGTDPVEETLPFQTKSQLYRFLRGGSSLSNMARSELLRHKKIEFKMSADLTIILEIMTDG